MGLVPAALVVDSDCQALLVFGLEVPAFVTPNAHLDIDTILFVAGCDSGAFAHGKWCFCSRKVLFCALFFKRSSLILYLVLPFLCCRPKKHMSWYLIRVGWTIQFCI